MHNIEKMIERTVKIFKCLRYNIFKSIFNHFFRFMYEINIFQHKRSNDFYRALKKVMLKKYSSKFFQVKMKDNNRVKILLKVI